MLATATASISRPAWVRSGAPWGTSLLECRLTVVPPDKAAWRYHCHHANDEMFVILGGSGTLRYGGESYPLRAGDVVMCPAGDPETAHQTANLGSDVLRTRGRPDSAVDYWDGE